MREAVESVVMKYSWSYPWRHVYRFLCSEHVSLLLHNLFVDIYVHS